MSKANSGGGAGPPGAGASPGGARQTGDGKHSVDLPKDQKRLTIDKAAQALKEMGGTLYRDTAETDLAKRQTSYVVKHNGKVSRMTTKEISKVVYSGKRE